MDLNVHESKRSRSGKGRLWPQISGSSNESFWTLFKHLKEGRKIPKGQSNS